MIVINEYKKLLRGRTTVRIVGFYIIFFNKIKIEIYRRY